MRHGCTKYVHMIFNVLAVLYLILDILDILM